MTDTKVKLPPRHPMSSSLPPSGKKKNKKGKDVSTSSTTTITNMNGRATRETTSMKTPNKRNKKMRNAKGQTKHGQNATTNGPFQEKANSILELLQQPEIDLWKLREECFTNGGLVNGTLLLVL
jgi:hypothetical protein